MHAVTHGLGVPPRPYFKPLLSCRFLAAPFKKMEFKSLLLITLLFIACITSAPLEGRRGNINKRYIGAGISAAFRSYRHIKNDQNDKHLSLDELEAIIATIPKPENIPQNYRN